MNRYLDNETQGSIKGRFVRIDEREIVGKTVTKAVYGFSFAGLAFTDGTWTGVWPQEDCEGNPDLDPNACCNRMDLYDIHDLGLITDEQLEVGKKYEQDRKKESKLEQLRRLQSELGITAEQEPA